MMPGGNTTLLLPMPAGGLRLGRRSQCNPLTDRANYECHLPTSLPGDNTPPLATLAVFTVSAERCLPSCGNAALRARALQTAVHHRHHRHWSVSARDGLLRGGKGPRSGA
jgi:hypothetical protein